MAFIAPLIPLAATFLGSATGALSAGTAALGAVSAISAGNYQSMVAKNNARIAESNSNAESMAAQQEAARNDRTNAALLADQTVSQATSGTSLGSRSNITARALTARSGREEAQDIARAGAASAQRLQQDAANFRAEGKRAKIQGYLNATGSVLNFAAGAGADQTPNAGGSLIGRRKRFG
jgi:hypothetical protein